MTTPIQLIQTGFRTPMGEWFNSIINVDNRLTGAAAVQVVKAAGATQGTATLISSTKGNVIKVTVTASTEGVKLPVCSTGAGPYTVMADPSVGVKVYPSTGGIIETAATNAAVALVKAKASIYVGVDKTHWRVVTGA